MFRVAELIRAFDELRLPAVAVDRETLAITEASAVAARIVGVGQEGFKAWAGRIHPDDRERVVGALRRAEPQQVIVRVTGAGTSFKVLRLELRPVDSSTFITWSEGPAESAEPELEALLEALPFEVWQRDASGALVRQNRAAVARWNAELGRTLDEMRLPEETRSVWQGLNERALAGEVVRAPMDYSDGEKVVSQMHLLAPVRRENAITGIVGVNIDVTAMREAETRLARTQEQLAKRERLAALGELAAVVAHEVRNPLASIFNSLSSLRRQLTLTGDSAILFDILDEESARLNRTVGDLLNYVRPLEPERRAEDLVELAREALKQGLNTAATGRKQVEGRVTAEGSFAPFVGDPVLLRIALVNLVINAVQAMPEGGRISIELARTSARSRDAVSIIVRDSGKGIPDDAIARVFEPFFTTRASGTGLGLALVRRIVEAHDGTVAASNDAARGGAAFTIVLPC